MDGMNVSESYWITTAILLGLAHLKFNHMFESAAINSLTESTNQTNKTQLTL